MAYEDRQQDWYPPLPTLAHAPLLPSLHLYTHPYPNTPPCNHSGQIKYGVVVYVYSYVGIINYVLLQVCICVFRPLSLFGPHPVSPPILSLARGRVRARSLSRAQARSLLPFSALRLL